jgi:uncharacterized membrane protein
VIAAEKDGVVRAFDSIGLVEAAQRTQSVIELVPQVGDFVPAGSALFRIYGRATGLSDAVLRRSVALGQERTIEQDPAFAFRIIVDVACKALSPAINDPTTAVLAIDCIHELLGAVGSRHLDQGRAVDAGGILRLVYRTPHWPEFVQLAVTEIRMFGADSIQIVRRLRAMLGSLIGTLPAERTALLREELDLLQRTASRSFPEPEDRALAHIPDQQGVGGVGTTTVDGEQTPPPAEPGIPDPPPRTREPPASPETAHSRPWAAPHAADTNPRP